MKFFTELANRWTKDSPKFFKKLQYISLYLIASTTAILVIPKIPETIKNIAEHTLIIGLVMGAISKLPVKDVDYKTIDKK